MKTTTDLIIMIVSGVIGGMLVPPTIKWLKRKGWLKSDNKDSENS